MFTLHTEKGRKRASAAEQVTWCHASHAFVTYSFTFVTGVEQEIFQDTEKEEKRIKIMTIIKFNFLLNSSIVTAQK